MRIPKTLAQLANDASKGIIHSTKVLRNNILNPSELNQLKLLDSHLDDLEAIIRAPDIDTGFSQNEQLSLELNVNAANIPLDDGYLVEGDTSYRQLKKYIDILNLDRPEESKYHLGHETGVYTYYLEILRASYNPDTSNVSDTNKAIVKRQKLLLDNALRASIVIDSLNTKDIARLKAAGLGSGLSADDLKLVLQSAGYAINLDVVVEKDVVKLLKAGKAKLTLTAELASENTLTGNLTNALSTMVKASFGSKTKKGRYIDKLLGGLDPTNIEGSPNIVDTIGNFLLNTAKGIKNKATRNSRATTSAKIRANKDSSVRLKRRINRRLVKLQGYLKTKRQKKKYIVPTVSLKALINESLAEWIRIRMAQSNAPVSLSYLRNQTGRFSESARLLTLNRTEAGAFLGTYGFNRSIYGTYLPGGRLHTQGRDPKLYIEGAIRDIAAKVLKRQFKGIALELT